MSEYVSILVTTEGSLQLYAAPGLSSHGDAREGWGIKGGAEVEWTGESHDYLKVRYSDPEIAKTIRAMLMERFPSRSAMVALIGETRGPNESVMWYRNGEPQIPEDIKTVHGSPDLSNCGHPLPAGLQYK